MSMEFSWWDFVPVVGALRKIRQACERWDEGDSSGALIHGALGVATLALDVWCIGKVLVLAKTAIQTGAMKLAQRGAEQLTAKELEEYVIARAVLNNALPFAFKV